VINLPPGCVELDEEEFMLGNFSIEVGIGEYEDSIFLLNFLSLGSKSSNGNAERSKIYLSHLFCFIMISTNKCFPPQSIY
jgi:hypothetical protein